VSEVWVERSRWRRRALTALVAALVLAAFAPWVARDRSVRSDAGVSIAEASESPVRRAQRIRRGPTEEEAPAKPETPAAPATPEAPKSPLATQNQADADRKSAGCMTCHTKTDSQSMHTATTVKLGCVDCHGGQVEVRAPEGASQGSPAYEAAKQQAHVLPKDTKLWSTSANPVHVYTALLRESEAFVQFVNPGDLRVAQRTCGAAGCHPSEVAQVEKSMMKTGPMLWGAALYNNGVFPIKRARFGEAYGPDGVPRRVVSQPPPTMEETVKKGVLAFLDPLPRFEVGQPGNVLRVFERGQQRPLEIGLPFVDEAPGRPANRLSQRGLGTLNRTDPVWLNLQRTRLFDPALSLLGNNMYPGEFRSSGCSACHVLYANDRSPVHSGEIAKYGHLGRTATADPTIPKDESGHPIRHQFTNSIPSSQCVNCHHHPGTTVTNSYLGTIWWDNETDGKLMYPEKERKLTPHQVFEIQRNNPEGSALRGLWSDKTFLENITDLNPKLTRTQFADYHGHGWVFRNVYKADRKGNLLDAENEVVPTEDPDRFKKAVHLKDIHLEKGMHCSDCHFKQDNHGNGKLYGEVRAAVEITCVDCHGSITARANLKTSGPAAPEGGTDLSLLTTPFGQRRFQWRGDTLIQRSTVTKELEWEVVQVLDSIDPASAWAQKNPRAAERSRLAKTLRKDGASWGDVPAKEAELAHADSRMTCFACHTSWVTSCFGCHLPMKANERKPLLHNEGTTQRNWTPYNFQTIRDDVFMLAQDGTTSGKRLSPARSTCAVLVGSQNGQREWVYSQQQTVSAEGFSGHAFSTFVPHTVRATETKHCTDCHVSRANDNNAWMASLLMQGTNYYNFIGRFAYVATGGKGLEAVVVTERDEPQAVIGSTLHRDAYPTAYAKHQANDGLLKDSIAHRGRDVLDLFGRDEVLSIQLRGEYLYTANGAGGFRAYDVAQVDQKGFSEKIVTAPVSPLGQRLYVKTKYATAVASPSTLAVDPTRSRRPENEEGPIHLVYAFLYVTDRDEGLIVIGNPLDSPNRPGVATLLDGDPVNNFLERAVTFNPDGLLTGAVNLTIAGHYAYVLAPKGLFVVDLDDPLQPKIVATVGAPHLVQPRAVAVQFRYAFVTDAEGVKVIDVTTPARPRPVPAAVKLAEAHGIYLARTYAYVAAGKQGLAILDIERPETPVLDQLYDAGGAINDARDVKVGMTNASLFAYVADGNNGLRVVQLTSPEGVPTYLGFSPRPRPTLIATARTRGPALAVSEGTDRDRAVDESGHQIAVFNRIGSRPMTLPEMQRLYMRNGEVYTVSEELPSAPRAPAEPKREQPATEPESGPRLRRPR
jgi:hypothetical protein